MSRREWGRAVLGAAGPWVALGCGRRGAKGAGATAVSILEVPEAGTGGAATLLPIGGKVEGARAGQRVVVFARSGAWWVQPFAAAPYTEIGADGRWRAETHPGTEYAALVTEADYRPPATTGELPRRGDGVVAVVSVTGRGVAAGPPAELRFGGYRWTVRNEPSERGGARNWYSAESAWVDERGRLHLRIGKSERGWECAEMTLERSLGYGSYQFVVAPREELEPAAVFGIFTWDGGAAEENFREINLELTRWGDRQSKNAQYVIQPYYVPMNVARFAMPPGRLRHGFRWEPGRISFLTETMDGRRVAGHEFTSGVPAPGRETVNLSLYIYGKSRVPFEREAEVVVESFAYLP